MGDSCENPLMQRHYFKKKERKVTLANVKSCRLTTEELELVRCYVGLGAFVEDGNAQAIAVAKQLHGICGYNLGVQVEEDDDDEESTASLEDIYEEYDTFTGKLVSDESKEASGRKLSFSMFRIPSSTSVEVPPEEDNLWSSQSDSDSNDLYLPCAVETEEQTTDNTTVSAVQNEDEEQLTAQDFVIEETFEPLVAIAQRKSLRHTKQQSGFSNGTLSATRDPGSQQRRSSGAVVSLPISNGPNLISRARSIGATKSKRRTLARSSSVKHVKPRQLSEEIDDEFNISAELRKITPRAATKPSPRGNRRRQGQERSARRPPATGATQEVSSRRLRLDLSHRSHRPGSADSRGPGSNRTSLTKLPAGHTGVSNGEALHKDDRPPSGGSGHAMFRNAYDSLDKSLDVPRLTVGKIAPRSGQQRAGRNDDGNEKTLKPIKTTGAIRSVKSAGVPVFPASDFPLRKNKKRRGSVSRAAERIVAQHGSRASELARRETFSSGELAKPVAPGPSSANPPRRMSPVHADLVRSARQNDESSLGVLAPPVGDMPKTLTTPPREMTNELFSSTPRVCGGFSMRLLPPILKR